MHKNRVLIGTIVLALVLVPSMALAQSTVRPALLANAFSNDNGPTVTFRENPARSDSAAPTISQMELSRPTRITVTAPPSGRTLGTLSYQVGGSTQTAGVTARKVALRGTALGHGRYELAHYRGSRVVLSTRSSRAFLSLTLEASARNVTVSLRGVGARLLSVRGRCTGQSFEARFVASTGEVVRDGSTIPSRALRSTGLC